MSKGPWREGRYEKSGESVSQSVLTPGGKAATSEERSSTPVTRHDYEGDGTQHSREPPGGDSG